MAAGSRVLPLPGAASTLPGTQPLAALPSCGACAAPDEAATHAATPPGCADVGASVATPPRSPRAKRVSWAPLVVDPPPGPPRFTDADPLELRLASALAERDQIVDAIARDEAELQGAALADVPAAHEALNWRRDALARAEALVESLRERMEAASAAGGDDET